MTFYVHIKPQKQTNESSIILFLFNFVIVVFEQAEPFVTPSHRVPIETVRAAGSLGRRV
jgi:hypothetical protein